MSCAVMAATAAAVPVAAKVTSRRRGRRIFVGTRGNVETGPAFPSRAGRRCAARGGSVAASAGDGVEATSERNDADASGSDSAPSDDAADAAEASFPAEIRALVADGADAALRAMDARLALAMRGEAADAADDDEASAREQAAKFAEAEDQAVQIVRCLKSSGSLRGFGAARLVPRRDYALSELKLNDIEAEKLLAPTESTISGLRDAASKTLLALAFAWVFAAHPDGRTVAGALAVFGGALATDQIAFGGGVEALALDTAAQRLSPAYVSRLRLHEAAHFLVAYLMGILPKGYTLSSLDAFEKYGALNVQAGCAFCDGEFQRETRLGKIGSASLGRFSCVALAGIGMEYVAYGYAEGGVSDVRQLDGMLRALAFSQKKSDSEVRWAVLNVITILRRHESVVRALADAMAVGATVGACVRLIEEKLGEDI
jgi:hypothetical protein